MIWRQVLFFDGFPAGINEKPEGIVYNPKFQINKEETKMDYEKYIDKEVLRKFEFYNYGHALEILHDAFPTEWNEVQECLRKMTKYGASTTWMGKLRYRLDSRRNGGCPILAIGIGKECVDGYDRINEYYTKLTELYKRKEV